MTPTTDPFLTPADDGEGDAIPTYCGEELPPRSLTARELDAWCESVRDTYQAGYQAGRAGRAIGTYTYTHQSAYRLGHRAGHEALMAAIARMI